MHILLVHQIFMASSEAGGTRHVELGEELIRRGHELSVIASSVSFLTGEKHFSIKDGFLKQEIVNGLHIRRVLTYSGVHKSYVGRVMSFLSFMIMAGIGALATKNVDVIWATSPPLLQAIPAYLASRIKKVPFILEVRDLWPAFAVETGVLRSRVLIWLGEKLETFLYRHADQLVINSPGFLSHIVDRNVPESKIEVVTNGVRSQEFVVTEGSGSAFRKEFDLGSKFVAMYAGAFGLANDLDTVLLAAAETRHRDDLLFALVGDGKERPRLEKLAADLQLDNIRFIPAQPKTRMPEALAAADACLATLKPIPMFKTTYPNKVFDYMASGRPTVLAIDGVIRQVIEEAEGGTFVTPGDHQALALAVNAYCDDPELAKKHGAQARFFVQTHFDRHIQGEKLSAIFEVFGDRHAAPQG